MTVFELDGRASLERPVEDDRNGVRGAWYYTLGDLRATGTPSELAERTGSARR